MQELIGNPALLGGLAGALVVALSSLVRGLFRIYELRKRRTFDPAMELELECKIQYVPRTDILHCEVRVRNVGEVRVVVDSALLELRAPLLHQEFTTGSWAYKLTWGEPEEFEAFGPGVLPGLVLNPQESYRTPGAIGLSSEIPDPIEVTLWVRSREDVYWSTVAMVTRVADRERPGDNQGVERR